MESSGEYIRWFSELGIGDVPLAGGNNASLGEIYRQLSGQGIRVPNGFAVTAEAYRYTLERGKAWPPLRDALAGLPPPMWMTLPGAPLPPVKSFTARRCRTISRAGASPDTGAEKNLPPRVPE